MSRLSNVEEVKTEFLNVWSTEQGRFKLFVIIIPNSSKELSLNRFVLLCIKLFVIPVCLIGDQPQLQIVKSSKQI